MITEFGLGLCNRELIADDWPRIRACGVRHLVDLHWFCGRWGTLAKEGAKVHARIDTRGPLGDPAEEARDTAEKVKVLGAYVEDWRRRNEPNIESPGVTPRQWGDWLAAYGKALKSLCPAAKFYAPAVSPGAADWLDWLAETARGAREGGLDGLDLHAYGMAGEVSRQVEAARSLWSGPLLWTEYNFGAGRAVDIAEYAGWLPTILSVANQSDIDVVCLFIWEWHKPDMALPTSCNVKGTVVETRLRELAAGDVQAPQGGTTVAKARIGNLDVIDLRSSLPRKGTYPTRRLSAIKNIVVHHSAVDVDSSAESITAYHVQTRGWPGIGYHFVVHWDGSIEYTMDMSLISYHVTSRNADCVGVCLPGNWSLRQPPDAQLAAARTLVANVQYALGWFITIVGHRDLAQTQCPGDTWGQWKERVIVRAPNAGGSSSTDWQRVAVEYQKRLAQIKELAAI